MGYEVGLTSAKSVYELHASQGQLNQFLNVIIHDIYIPIVYFIPYLFEMTKFLGPRQHHRLSFPWSE